MLRMDISGRILRVARPKDEWYVDVEDPEGEIRALKNGQHGRVDLFTFWQRIPATAPRFSYRWEPELVAALPISSYEKWWNQQIDGKTRNLVRKAHKKGLLVKSVPFDDGLVDGIADIFNETPIRQGRRFWHYGKSRELIKQEMSDQLDISVFIGAYLERRLLGFVKLLLLPNYAMMVEIISKVKQRDKAPNNALIAGAVKECAERRIPFLTYSTWGGESLAAFKESNGFERLPLPRYYVPLSVRGHLALRFNLHRGLNALLPESLKGQLKDLRRRWHARMAEN
jgi:hypothetical protein